MQCTFIFHFQMQKNGNTHEQSVIFDQTEERGIITNIRIFDKNYSSPSSIFQKAPQMTEADPVFFNRGGGAKDYGAHQDQEAQSPLRLGCRALMRTLEALVL